MSVLEGVVGQVQQRPDGVADLIESLAHGVAVDVAVVDAFRDHGELEQGERDVPAERGDVAA
jgi:hypothetical protein